MVALGGSGSRRRWTSYPRPTCRSGDLGLDRARLRHQLGVDRLPQLLEERRRIRPRDQVPGPVLPPVGHRPLAVCVHLRTRPPLRRQRAQVVDGELVARTRPCG